MSRLGAGIYSIPEAARLSGVNPQRIRRWIRGYSYNAPSGRRRSPPVVEGQRDSDGGSLHLSFLDLIEVRFIDQFRRRGVSWSTIRTASARAAALLEQDHPFATKRFETDGRTILMEIAEATGEGNLLDLMKSQVAIRKVIWPYLYDSVDFDVDLKASRWWPMTRRSSVVVDSSRLFGQPIVSREGVPTGALAAAFRAEGSLDRVASWYEVSRKSVRDAVDFEEKLEAA